MPLITLKTSKTLSEDQKLNIKKDFAEAISIIPNKTEAVTMIIIEDKKEIFFGGKRGDFANVNIKLYAKPIADASTHMPILSITGKTDENTTQDNFDLKQQVTQRFFKILESVIAIDSNSCYIQFDSHMEWGTKGNLK